MRDSHREWVFTERPDGEPDMDCFELRERDVPEPSAGELLVRVRYLSVDPYVRGRMRDAESYAEPWDVGDPMNGAIVGEVVESEPDSSRPPINSPMGHDLRPDPPRNDCRGTRERTGRVSRAVLRRQHRQAGRRRRDTAVTLGRRLASAPLCQQFGDSHSVS